MSHLISLVVKCLRKGLLTSGLDNSVLIALILLNLRGCSGKPIHSKLNKEINEARKAINERFSPAISSKAEEGQVFTLLK